MVSLPREPKPEGWWEAKLDCRKEGNRGELVDDLPSLVYSNSLRTGKIQHFVDGYSSTTYKWSIFNSKLLVITRGKDQWEFQDPKMKVR